MREQILRAATRLIAAHGFEGMTLQAVADEVGIRKPSVLHHFPSKEALRQGVIDDMLSHWSGVLPQVLRTAGAGAKRFDALTRELVHFFADDPDRARLLVRETLDRPRDIRRLYLERVRPWLVTIAESLDEGQRRGTHWADLDAEAYLVHMLQLIIVSIAAGGVFSSQPAASERAARGIRELLRIARTSLFTHDALRALADARAESKKVVDAAATRSRPRRRTPATRS